MFTVEQLNDKVAEWAYNRGIHTNYSNQAQIAKLTEEFAELQTAIVNNDIDNIADSIGDMMVVMTNIATNYGLTLRLCYEFAYDQIKDRKGKMVNGTFVKD